MGKQLNRTEFIASGMEALSAQIEPIQTMQEQILLAEGKWQRELTEHLAEEYLIAGGAEYMLSKEIGVGYDPVGWTEVSRKLKELSDTGEEEKRADFARKLIRINEELMTDLENCHGNRNATGRCLAAWRSNLKACTETGE